MKNIDWEATGDISPEMYEYVINQIDCLKKKCEENPDDNRAKVILKAFENILKFIEN